LRWPQHGKHIFCEKPVALDLAQTDRALAAVAAAGVTLQIGFNRRFDANFGRMQQAAGQWRHRHPQDFAYCQSRPGTPPISYIKVSGGFFSI
jgi:myo-inositol 2-dehydrogenase/D-chiro-inositol 1-dehydrogenase